MGNIETYAKEYGSLTFDEKPFGDVDNLILSYLVYYSFSGIVPSPEEEREVTLQEAAAKYAETIGTAQWNVRWQLLDIMRGSVRYRNMRLSGFIDIFRVSSTQFASLCIRLPDGTPYITFRGVDNSITGWQEAFEICYKETSAQKMAVGYVQKLLPKYLDSSPAFLLGGHSKGGNMALYAAAHIKKELRDHIKRIWLNDSPGLVPGSYDPVVLAEFEDRITRIVPEFTVIDSLYKTQPPDRIVKGLVDGIGQHEPMYWTVEDDDFTETGAIDPQALELQVILRDWIDRASRKSRKGFVEDVFSTIRRSRDEGTAPDLSDRKAVIRFALKTYAGASLPAKRAIRGLVTAAAREKLRAWFSQKS